MSILKATGVAVDINAAPDVVANARLISVLNTGAAFPLVNVGTGNNLYIAAGERVVIEKAPSDALDAVGGTASVWATPIAYKK
jgi:hypothetical protein